MASVLQLSGCTAYPSHPLHSDERSWPETNCYMDLWIEVLHAQGLEPTAALPCTLALDFEGDQYTFFKFSLDDIRALYGVEVQELNLWRPLTDHAVEQTAAGRLLMVEANSYFLPDTAGVTYGIAHDKTTIAIDSIDVAQRRASYFHNRGYFTVEGDDFAGVFRLDAHAPAPTALPPYAEIAKLERVVHRSTDDLAHRSMVLAAEYLRNRPAKNPVALHRARISRDLEWLKAEPLARFHQYAFATVRQAGSCFGLTASYLRWLERANGTPLEPAAAAFDSISLAAKAVQFKLARMANTKRDVDITSLLETMERGWDEGMSRLVDCWLP